MPEVAANRRTGTSGFSVKYPLVFGQRSGCFLERTSFFFALCAEISARSPRELANPQAKHVWTGLIYFPCFLVRRWLPTADTFGRPQPRRANNGLHGRADPVGATSGRRF